MSNKKNGRASLQKSNDRAKMKNHFNFVFREIDQIILELNVASFGLIGQANY